MVKAKYFHCVKKIRTRQHGTSPSVCRRLQKEKEPWRQQELRPRCSLEGCVRTHAYGVCTYVCTHVSYTCANTTPAFHVCMCVGTRATLLCKVCCTFAHSTMFICILTIYVFPTSYVKCMLMWNVCMCAWLLMSVCVSPYVECVCMSMFLFWYGWVSVYTHVKCLCMCACMWVCVIHICVLFLCCVCMHVWCVFCEVSVYVSILVCCICTYICICMICVYVCLHMWSVCVCLCEVCVDFSVLVCCIYGYAEYVYICVYVFVCICGVPWKYSVYVCRCV